MTVPGPPPRGPQARSPVHREAWGVTDPQSHPTKPLLARRSATKKLTRHVREATNTHRKEDRDEPVRNKSKVENRNDLIKNSNADP